MVRSYDPQRLLLRPEGYLTQLEQKELRLNLKLSLCGQWCDKNFYCKKDPNDIHLLETRETQFFCQIHYCNHPECMVKRVASQMNVFDDMDRLKGLRKLWHFAISFEEMGLHEFKGDYDKYRKRQYYILNKFFEKCKKRGLDIQAVRCWDANFQEGMRMVPHFHFGALPVGGQKIKHYLTIMQEVRKTMIKNMKIKTPFHFESFGLKKKQAVLFYLAKRIAGLYSWHDGKKAVYTPSGKGKLLRDIKNGKYWTLKDVLTPKEYIKDFYGRQHFACIGGLPRPRHGSILIDNIPNFCNKHGVLEPKDIRVEIIFKDKTSKPPNIKEYPEEKIEIVKMNSFVSTPAHHYPPELEKYMQ